MSVSIGAVTTSNDYNGVINKPAGTVVGDLLLAFVGCNTGGDYWSAPGGWVTQDYNYTGANSGRVMTKIVTASEPSSYTFAFSGNGAHTKRMLIMRISGARLSSPFDVSPVLWADTSTSRSILTPDLASSQGGVALALWWFNAYNSTTTWTYPSGWTQATDVNQDDIGIAAAWSTYSAATNVSGPTAIVNYDGGGGRMGTSMFLVGDNVLTVAGSLTPAGSRLKASAKTLAGLVASSGTLTPMRVVLAVLTASVAAVGVHVRQVPKLFEASLALAAARVRATLKALDGALTPAATLRRTPVRLLTASVALTGDLGTRFLGRVFGRPGVVVLAVRAAGFVRARVRRG